MKNNTNKGGPAKLSRPMDFLDFDRPNDGLIIVSQHGIASTIEQMEASLEP